MALLLSSLMRTLRLLFVVFVVSVTIRPNNNGGRSSSGVATALTNAGGSTSTTTTTTTSTAVATRRRDATALPANAKSILSHKKVVVVGGGPVGLYFAALLLQKDPTVHIEILEKAPKRPTTSNHHNNAYGLGVNTRMQRRLQQVPGLYEKAISISSILEALGIPLVSRDDLVDNMRSFLEETHSKNNKNSKHTRFTIHQGEGCATVDFSKQTLTTSRGRTIRYDLLVGADGVHSGIRKLLNERLSGGDDDDDDDDDAQQLQEQHHVNDGRWKALHLPKQPHLSESSFKPIHHPLIGAGRILPKAPEGHILLLFWNNQLHDPSTNNPIGLSTAQDWKDALNESLNEKSSMFQQLVTNPLRRMVGFGIGDDDSSEKRSFVFDEGALEAFVTAPDKGSTHLRLERYHYSKGNVVLIGDAAHSFSSLLGQGCALGLESTHTLVDCLLLDTNNNTSSTTAATTTPTTTTTTATSIGDALEHYTQRAIVESHAMTELALISFAIKGGWNAMTLKCFPLILWNTLLGKGLLKRLKDTSVPYSAIVRENKRLLGYCRVEFEKTRTPFVPRSK